MLLFFLFSYLSLEHVCYYVVGAILCDTCMLLYYVRYRAWNVCAVLGLVLCDVCMLGACVLLRALEHVCAAVCFQV
jgi:hypothetical protein